GYNFVVNYRNNNTFFKDAQYNEYRKSPVKSENELFRDRGSEGQVSQRDVLWTVLLGQSIKINRSKISLNIFHTQNGISSAANITQVNSESNPATIVKQNLQYQQRSISNLNLSGLHYLDTNKHLKL